MRKAGNSVRITAQLIRAGTDTHLWSQTYDRKLDDVFAIQDEIAADVVKQLKVTLLGAAPTARTTDPAAYALYLQAVQLGWHGTAEAFEQSDALFRKVLVIDPRYAPACRRAFAPSAPRAGTARSRRRSRRRARPPAASRP